MLPLFPSTCFSLYLVLVCLHILTGHFSTVTTLEMKLYLMSPAKKSNIRGDTYTMRSGGRRGGVGQGKNEMLSEVRGWGGVASLLDVEFLFF